MNPQLQAALDYTASGLSVLPIRADGSKAPSVRLNFVLDLIHGCDTINLAKTRMRRFVFLGTKQSLRIKTSTARPVDFSGKAPILVLADRVDLAWGSAGFAVSAASLPVNFQLGNKYAVSR